MNITITTEELGTRKFDSIYSSIEYLKGIEQESYEKSVANKITEFALKYPFVESIKGSAIGTYYKYESAGNTYEHECWEDTIVDWNDEHPEFSEEKLKEARAESPSISPWILLDEYPQRGGSQIIAYITVYDDFYNEYNRLENDPLKEGEVPEVIIDYDLQYYDPE